MTDPSTAEREPRTPTAIRVLSHREWWEWLPEATQMSRVRDLSDVFLAIEAEAARLALDGVRVDPERLARAMEDVFPGWLEEAPGSAEAQAEMRSYAEQLVRAYDFLADSASNDVLAALSAQGEPRE